MTTQQKKKKTSHILRFSTMVISPSDDRSSERFRRDDSSVGIGTWAIVLGFMGCRRFPLEIGGLIRSEEGEEEEAVKFLRSWSKKKRHEISKEKKKSNFNNITAIIYFYNLKRARIQSNDDEEEEKKKEKSRESILVCIDMCLTWRKWRYELI